jgi:hypothetical protein
MSIADMRKIMLHSAYYKEWKQDPKNSKKVKPLQRLNADGEISEELLEKNDPYWPDRVGEKKCACHPHTGMQYACKAISHWRRLQHVNCDCDCANCGGSPDSPTVRSIKRILLRHQMSLLWVIASPVHAILSRIFAHSNAC